MTLMQAENKRDSSTRTPQDGNNEASRKLEMMDTTTMMENDDGKDRVE